MIENFATVPLSKVLENDTRPNTEPPAPYLLVVDDDDAIANSFGSILRNVGYAVTVVYDAESALQIAELAPPELVITDFRLPGMNGVELALRLQKLIADCKLFFVTGQPDETARFVEAASPDRFQILAKPIHPAELLECVAQMLPMTMTTPRADTQRHRNLASRTEES
ncbi:MAG: response regulator [Acidobacteriaceae bacterium]